MRRGVEPTYRPSGEDGEIVVYAGDLVVKMGDVERTVTGRLELRLAPTPGLVARFASPSSDMYFVSAEQERTVSVPAGAQLAPPTESRLLENPGHRDWLDEPIIMNELEAGDALAAQRFVFHISGALGLKAQLDFALPGWGLVIAPVDDRRDEHDFSFVVEATPESPRNTADVKKLAGRLFILLSFMTSREVGVVPVCGLSTTGDVIWASWGAPRMRPGCPGVRWCPNGHVATAFPEIVKGFAELSKDEGLEAVVDRVINHLLAANGNEALDLRVPIACAGLEMIGWAVLQRDGSVKSDVLKKMKAPEMARRLLGWAHIQTTIPPRLAALESRLHDLHKGGGAPEVLVGVRNRLVHPPRRLDSPKWPSSPELAQAWQLATWYLELVVLRVLGYQGRYWSRLDLGRYGADLEQVPWAAERVPAANCS